ncbi:MAG TPA: S8 family serine peptidase [Candidatus Eisenbacteria bacterium]|nr:S8 family serine peptidase [Candidatus Eisenbacteria bacterium]
MTCTLAPSRRRRHFRIPLAILAIALCAGALALAPTPARAAAVPFVAAPNELFVPGELLVQFRAGPTKADRARIAREAGATLTRELTPDGLVKVKIEGDGTTDRAAARLRTRAEVEYVVPNLKAKAFFTPDDSLITSETMDLAWNLREVQAYDAWDIQTGDPDIVVAIIDTGVAYEDRAVPPYEQEKLWPGTQTYKQSPDLPGPFVPGWDFINEDAYADDDNGHGTTVATIVAGAPNNIAGSAGIAFGVTIMPIKVIDWRRDSEMAFIVGGIRYAADHGADIVNLSLGFPPLDVFRGLLGYTESELREFFRPLREVVSYAQRRGCILVASAGNFDAIETSLPAGYPGVIAVGATDPDGRRSSYSSYGRGLDFMAPGGDFGDLNNDHVQDAVFVLSIKPNRSEGSLAKPDSFGCFPFFGTSGSAPHVSGAVALMMSKGYRSQGAIEQTLRDTAVRPPDRLPGIDAEYAAGLIQIADALRARMPNGATNATPTTTEGTIAARLLSRNPARGDVSIAFRSERPGRVRVRVFDVRGALVRTLDDREAAAGEQRARWDGRDDGGGFAAAGVYFFRVETPEGVATRKIAYLR